jgi:hypothetical protein
VTASTPPAARSPAGFAQLGCMRSPGGVLVAVCAAVTAGVHPPSCLPPSLTTGPARAAATHRRRLLPVHVRRGQGARRRAAGVRFVRLPRPGSQHHSGPRAAGRHAPGVDDGSMRRRASGNAGRPASMLFFFAGAPGCLHPFCGCMDVPLCLRFGSAAALTAHPDVRTSFAPRVRVCWPLPHWPAPLRQEGGRLQQRSLPVHLLPSLLTPPHPVPSP